MKTIILYDRSILGKLQANYKKGDSTIKLFNSKNGFIYFVDKSDLEIFFNLYKSNSKKLISLSKKQFLIIQKKPQCKFIELIIQTKGIQDSIFILLDLESISKLNNLLS